MSSSLLLFITHSPHKSIVALFIAFTVYGAGAIVTIHQSMINNAQSITEVSRMSVFEL